VNKKHAIGHFAKKTVQAVCDQRFTDQLLLKMRKPDTVKQQTKYGQGKFYYLNISIIIV